MEDYVRIAQIHKENPQEAHGQVVPYHVSAHFLGGPVESDIYCRVCNKGLTRLASPQEIQERERLNRKPLPQ